MSDAKFKFLRRQVGPFLAYRGFGTPGQEHVISQVTPWARLTYFNIFMVNKGYIDCEGPQGSNYGVKRFEEGQMHTELPDYPAAGDYILRPGPEGVDVWCIGAEGRKMFCREIVSLNKGDMHVLVKGHILVMGFGSLKIDNAETESGPFILSGMENERRVLAKEQSKGMELWLMPQ